MAKKIKESTEKYRTITTPSHFGSHSSMIDQEETDRLDDPDKVVLSDDEGKYITEKSRLDSGLADVNRYDFISRQEIVDEKEL